MLWDLNTTGLEFTCEFGTQFPGVKLARMLYAVSEHVNELNWITKYCKVFIVSVSSISRPLGGVKHDTGKQRENSNTLTSIARDRHFSHVSEIVHRSNLRSQPRQNDSDLFRQRSSETTSKKRITGWSQTEYQAKNMFKRFLILFTTRGIHYHGTLREIESVKITAIQFAFLKLESKETSKIWNEILNPRRSDRR